MASRPRNEEAGAIYHVYSRGVDRRRTFVDEEDYRRYTALLGEVVRRKGWHLLCYCLMPNHVHLMIETPDTNLGSGMQWLHSCYARAFNQRHGRSGHLFEERFKSPKVRSEGRFVRLVGYIVVNPLVARLCGRAEDWPWASHARIVHERPLPSWIAHPRLLEHLEAMTGSECYAELVETRERGLVDAGRRKTPEV